jgi:antitoxin (DNA-binding transcriptional repressor) of toxin-antitoxin stability system
LIRAVEEGEEVVITRHGKPVAQLAAPPPERRQPVRLGGMKDRIHFLPGWDAPVDLDRFSRRRSVSGYLLDTNAALIALTDPSRLPVP